MRRAHNALLVALALAVVGFFWLAVAPTVAVRHWTSDTNVNVNCRQMLNGLVQWSDPAVGRAWSVQRGDSAYC